MPPKKQVVIIGNGIAGVTTARHLRKNDSDVRITLISAESKYFFSRTALMYVYMGHMKFENIKPYEDWFWEKNSIELLQDYVEKVIPVERKLQLRSGKVMEYDDLVIATGSRPKFYDWPGQDLDGVQGLVSLQDLENLEKRTPAPLDGNKRGMRSVIVGGGLIGVELAEMLLTRNVPVTMLIRENVFWGHVLTEEEGKRISAHIRSHGVDLRSKTELEKINGENGKVISITTKTGEEITCDLVGITTGVTPNVEFLEGTGIEINRGIMVDDHLRTNVKNIYAAGDCAELRKTAKGRRALEAVWYVGRMMGEVLGKVLAGKESSYRQGPWFNSAKFFDIEYQVYGMVIPKENEEHKHFFWEMTPEKFITLDYHPETQKLNGISTFGIRMRHEFFDKAFRKELTVGGQIHKANFDPEFYKKWHKKFKQEFQSETGIELPKSILQKLI